MKRTNTTLFTALLLSIGASTPLLAQQKSLHSEMLHTAQPDYAVPYTVPKSEDVVKVLDRVHGYLNSNTPMNVISKTTNKSITDFTKIDTSAVVERGTFSLTSYEWGVTYSGMLAVAEATGDKRYADYALKRMQFLAEKAPYFKEVLKQNPNSKALHQVIAPHALDDCGAVSAAMIKATLAHKPATDLRPLIDNFLNYISTKEFRLADGTLARNRPQANTIWLDDLFMGVPALAQMGKLTGDNRYFDDAVKQVSQFSKRMFNTQKNVFMHGWVAGMETHPEFHWGRANGWAILTMVELLDVLPENHAGRNEVLNLLRLHAKGLASYQTGSGFWHQLLDRPDSYLETSATAIYAYCFARGINKGWLDAKAFGPATLLAWNAVATKVNQKGEVEGVCVGTGMGFEPAFYYYRPINVLAAHGYGPVLLAGAEMITLMKNGKFTINDSAMQYNK
jgi:rhamnogalacturonyl hydrolase YesR